MFYSLRIPRPYAPPRAARRGVLHAKQIHSSSGCVLRWLFAQQNMHKLLVVHDGQCIPALPKKFPLDVDVHSQAHALENQLEGRRHASLHQAPDEGTAAGHTATGASSGQDQVGHALRNDHWLETGPWHKLCYGHAACINGNARGGYAREPREQNTC